jgi:putative ABC transport system ATP-binding protein
MEFNIEKLNLIYDMDKAAQTIGLRDVNLALSGNRLVGILGPSGSGKSSLLYCMAGLRRQTSGNVSFEGHSYKDMSTAKLAALRRSDFGFVFQRHFLVEYMTILDNVLTPVNASSKKMRDKALNLLGRLGIEELANKKPHQLSGGQRQKAAIARALINEPKVIFGDEPTASLDHASAREVMKLLDEYKQNAMVLIVTHDESILDNADTIIRIWDGAISSVQNKEEGATA